MGQFKKYAFTDEAEAQVYIDALSTEEEPTNNAVIKIGFYVVTQGTYNEQGDEITPPIMSDGYMVDVDWVDKKDKDWKDFRFKLNGAPNYHDIAGRTYSDNTN